MIKMEINNYVILVNKYVSIYTLTYLASQIRDRYEPFVSCKHSCETNIITAAISCILNTMDTSKHNNDRRKGGREGNNKGKGEQRKRRHEMHMMDSGDSNYRCYTETI